MDKMTRDLIDSVAFAVSGTLPTTPKARETAKLVIEIVRNSIASAPPSTPVGVEKVKKALERLDSTIEACAKLTLLLGDGQPHSDLISTAGGQAALAKEAIQRALSQQTAAARVDVRKLVALAEQMERDAAGCRRDGYIDAAVVKEDCAYRIRQTLGISAIAEAVGVDAPGSREWMAEVCRAAALSLAAHGVCNDQLLKVADWITQQPASGATDAGYNYGLQFIDDHPQLG